MYVHKGLGYIYTQIMMKHRSWTTHADPVYDFPSSSMCMAKTDVRGNKDDERHMYEIKSKESCRASAQPNERATCLRGT